MRRTVLALCAIVATSLVFFAASTASAAGEVGPAFGKTKYTTEIKTVDAIEDVDDYVSPLLAGETLSVSLAASKKGGLVPQLVVLDPDGVDRTPQLKNAAGGKKLSFKKFVIDKTGSWVVRVSGANASEGEYTVSFKVKKAKKVSLKKQTLDAAAATEATHQFDALEGALVTITIKFSKKGAPVKVVSLLDPDGNDVPGNPGIAADKFTAKGTKVSIKKLPAAAGDGTYELTVGIDAGTAEYSVSISQTQPVRPKKKIKLPVDEPFLDALVDPLRGVEGRTLTLNGRNFGDPESLPTVFFDGVKGTVTSVAPSGTSAVVVPPRGTHGATVSVAVADPFGQAFRRDGYFFYVPPPTLLRLVDDADTPFTGGTANGGAALRLIGTGFEAGQTVKLGTRNAISLAFVSDTEFRFTTPAAPAGSVLVQLTDLFGRTANLPLLFDYKAAPTVSSVASQAYSPEVGAEVGGTPITMTGTGFDPLDQVHFDGAPVASGFISTTTRTFTSPAKNPGAYSVTVTDRFGAVATGPDFRVKAPPELTAVEANGSALLANGGTGLGGGAALRVVGKNFEEGDIVVIGSTDIIPEPIVVTTTIAFTTPALPIGKYDISVRDVLGDTSTLVDGVQGVGFDDVTSTLLPGITVEDDLTSRAGAVGDLDLDGEIDDVVILGTNGGTRTMNTRFLQGDSSGVLKDVTGTRLPTGATDPNGFDWDGTAIAIGDLDGVAGAEIVVADAIYYNGATYYYYDGVRVMGNDGAGNFTFSSSITANANYYWAGGYVYVTDEYGDQHQIGITAAPFPNVGPNALAIGDLDRDGDNDVVSAASQCAFHYFYYDFTKADFTQQPYYMTYSDATTYAFSYGYGSALRILENESGKLVDRTLNRFGVLGFASKLPGFFGRDVSIADIDGKDGPDIVVAWDDPQTVSMAGFVSGTDTAQIATRILINDGSGFFSDDTVNWMPSSTTTEFWQGNGVEVANVTGDARLDLLIIQESPPNTGDPGLRILRNNGTTFTDVTAAVLPAVTVNENHAGSALAVYDVNGDTFNDILIGTTQALVDGSNNARRSTRLLLGNANGTFTYAPEFLPEVTTESGETPFIILGEMEGRNDPTLILGGETAPTNGPGSELLRGLDWKD